MYVSIPDAIKLTGKSQATIYRLVKKAKSSPYIKMEGGNTIIDKEYLLSIYPTFINSHMVQNENWNEKSVNYGIKLDNSERKVLLDLIQDYNAQLMIEKERQIQHLKSEMETKNHQLDRKDRIIAELNTSNQVLSERLRETNINLQTLQLSFSQLVKHLPEARHNNLDSQEQKRQTNLIPFYIIAFVSFLVLALLLIRSLLR